MRRKTFDKLVASAGLVIATLLVAAGSLMAWGSSFISDQVGTQLAAQKIYFPEKGKKTQMLSGSAADAAKELVKRLREEARAL